MTDYDSYDQLPAVAQSCKNFKSNRMGSIRFNSTPDSISCSSCSNWNGSGCVRNDFDSAYNRLENG